MKRVSIATCMASIVILAIGSAALTHPTELWASTMFTLAVVLLSWASVAAVIRRRAFWVGFAIFGWVYLAMNLFSAKGTQAGSFPPPLLTTKIIDFIEPAIFDTTPPFQPPVAPQSTTYANTPFSITFLGQPDLSRTYFHQVGHCLMALIVAIIAGLAAGIVLRKEGHAPVESDQALQS